MSNLPARILVCLAWLSLPFACRAGTVVTADGLSLALDSDNGRITAVTIGGVSQPLLAGVVNGFTCRQFHRVVYAEPRSAWRPTSARPTATGAKCT